MSKSVVAFISLFFPPFPAFYDIYFITICVYILWVFLHILLHATRETKKLELWLKCNKRENKKTILQSLIHSVKTLQVTREKKITTGSLTIAINVMTLVPPLRFSKILISLLIFFFFTGWKQHKMKHNISAKVYSLNYEVVKSCTN